MWKFVGKMTLTFLLYFAAGKVGLLLASLNHSTSPVWPATGVAIASCFIWGRVALGGILFGALAVNFLNGSGFWISLAIACGNTCEAMIANELFRLFSRRVKGSGDANAKTSSQALAICIGCLFGAFVGTSTLILADVINIDDFVQNWTTWFVGDFVGGLVIFPLLVSFFDQTLYSSWRRQVAALLVIFAASALFYFSMLGELRYHSVFFVFPFIVVIAIIADSRFVFLNTVLLTCVAIYATLIGVGPFNIESQNDNLLNLQLYIGTLAITSVFLSNIKRNLLRSNHLLVLATGWAICWLISINFESSIKQKDDLKFRNLISDLSSSLEARINDNIRLLVAAQGFFGASKEVDPLEWAAFVNALDLRKWNSSASAFSVIFEVPKAFRAEYLDWAQKNISPSFKIHEYPGGENLTDEDWVLTYVEPRDHNVAALGRLVSSEKRRFEALRDARDSGQVVISAPILVRKDDQSIPGFALVLPLPNRSGFPLAGLTSGWIAMPMNWQDIFVGLLKVGRNQIGFDVYDGPMTPSADNLIYSSKNLRNQKLDQFQTVTALNIGGRTLSIAWYPSLSFFSSRNHLFSWSIVTGMLITLLLTGIVSNLQTLQQRAQSIADANSLALKQREIELSNILDLVPVGIFKSDFSGHCYFSNAKWRQIVGAEGCADEAVNFFEVIDPADRGNITQQTQETVRSHGRSVMEFALQRKDSLEKQVRVEVVTEDRQSNAGFFLGCVQDVTDLRKAERELEQQRLAAAQAAKMSALGEMAGGIAHEINNPLAIIHGRAYRSLKLLEGENINKEIIVTDLESIGDTANRIARIVKGLRAFSRNGNSDPFENVALTSIMDQVLELCRERFKNNSIEMYIDELPNWIIKCRSVQILQVFINLLNNAFDAIKGLEEKWVRIEFNEEDDLYVIAMTDCGKGIPESVSKKMFEPFFTTKEVGQGTGLGLSISKGLIEDNKGTLVYDTSSPHTKFVLSFPKVSHRSVA